MFDLRLTRRADRGAAAGRSARLRLREDLEGRARELGAAHRGVHAPPPVAGAVRDPGRRPPRDRGRRAAALRVAGDRAGARPGGVHQDRQAVGQRARAAEAEGARAFPAGGPPSCRRPRRARGSRSSGAPSSRRPPPSTAAPDSAEPGAVMAVNKAPATLPGRTDAGGRSGPGHGDRAGLVPRALRRAGVPGGAGARLGARRRRARPGDRARSSPSPTTGWWRTRSTC